VRDFDGRMMSGWGYSESPLVDGDWVLCTPGSRRAMIVALDKMTGREVWRTAVPNLGDNGKEGAGYSSIVVSQGAGVKQYVQLVGRGVIGVRASDGKFLWGYNRVANGTANIPTPICTGDFVFASTGYGTGACLLKLVPSAGGVIAEEQYFLEAGTFQNHHGGMVLVDFRGNLGAGRIEEEKEGIAFIDLSGKPFIPVACPVGVQEVQFLAQLFTTQIAETKLPFFIVLVLNNRIDSFRGGSSRLNPACRFHFPASCAQELRYLSAFLPLQSMALLPAVEKLVRPAFLLLGGCEPEDRVENQIRHDHHQAGDCRTHGRGEGADHLRQIRGIPARGRLERPEGEHQGQRRPQKAQERKQFRQQQAERAIPLQVLHEQNALPPPTAVQADEMGNDQASAQTEDQPVKGIPLYRFPIRLPHRPSPFPVRTGLSATGCPKTK
jgi:hypothetical protein